MSNSVISQRIQDSFVFLIITDTKFLQLARKSVKPEYFSSQITEDIVRICYSYFDQFKEAAHNHLHDEMVRFLKKKDFDEKNRYYTYLKKIQEMDSPNQAYVVKRINNFIKAREFEEAAIDFVQKVEIGDFTAAKELMQKALRVGIEREEIGLKYFELEKPPDYFTSMKEILLPTGFPLIDSRIKGLRRGQFVVLLGGYKVGKTWSCIHLGKQGLLCGKKVLHITHEASLDEVEMRYDMSLGGLTSEKRKEEVKFRVIDEEGVEEDSFYKIVNTVYDFNEIKNMRKKLGKIGGELIIRKYPMGTCTMNEIDRYLDYLETYENFVPDILINDYVETMKMPLGETAAHRDRINQAYIEHKRIADERNILVFTVSQAVRASLGKFRLKQADFAEDIRKVGNVDLALGISQTEIQAEEQKMTIFVLAGRSVPQGFGCIVSTNLRIGQLCTNSWHIRRKEKKEES
ncbi:MAG: DnaB-like helicase C-terminal domain-containing protein [Candidatus Heimdallarchaeaceae archaeon]